MKNILSITFLAALIGLAGCDSSSTPEPIPDTPSPPPPAAQIQVVHAVADAPGVNVNVGGPTPDGSDLLDLEFSGVVNSSFRPGAFDVSVDAVLPDGTAVEVIPATNIDFVIDTRTIIVATGAVGAIEPIVLTQDVPDAATTGTTRLRVLHAAPGVGMVDVYATAPDADLAASAPVATIAFQQASEVLDVPPGDYQLRVTPMGDPATVVFDAGTTTLVGGQDILAVAVENTTASTSPITLIVADSSTGDSDVVQDVAGEADLRVVHASPDAGPVDVLADGAAIVAGAVYTNVATIPDLPPATYDIQITAAGDPTTVAFQADVALDSGGAYDAIALGSTMAMPGDANEFTVLLTADDYRRIATEAKLRLIHGSASAGNVDIYVVEAGTDITTVPATAAGAGLGVNSGFLSLFEGSYDIVITVAGDATLEALRLNGVALAAGGVYSAIAIDDPLIMGAFSIIPLDDLAP